MGLSQPNEPTTADPRIERALRSVVADAELWATFANALRAAEGLDHDFPEGNFEGPVGRLHRANAQVMHAAACSEPSLIEDWRGQNELLRAAYAAIAPGGR